MGVVKLKWRQVNAWRLSRQGFSMRLTRRQRLEGVTRPLELQAQMLSAVVLVDGVIRGLWDYKTRRGQTVVSVGMFAAPIPRLRRAIEEQAARLGEYLRTEAEVSFTEV